MNGKDYIALRRLSLADDTTVAAVGETCERVPPSSLESLLASGKIAPAPARKGQAK
jgi:hypothetical protein